MSNMKQSWNDLEPPSEIYGHSVAPGDLGQPPSVLGQAHSNKRIKYGQPLHVKAAMGLFEEYCGSSTIHGVRYFAEKKRHWMERVWWILAFSLAVLCCGKLIHDIYIKWDQSPVIVNFARLTSISEIPFPAVTICPETKANIEQLSFTDIFFKMKSTRKYPYNITDKENELMSAMVHICRPFLVGYFEIGTNFTNSSIIKLLSDTAPRLIDTMIICRFQKLKSFCDKYFAEIMTEEGLCFTFNTLKGSEMYNKDISPEYPQMDHNMSANFWNLEDGYNRSREIDPQTYPYRVFGSSASASLSVVLRLSEKNFDYMCRGSQQGFKILFHTPGEVPQMSKYFFRVPLQQKVLVSVKPNMITTSKGLRHYGPNRRQCYFASERKLRFLKLYTQRNCELECLANYTMQACGCVKFSMPRDKNTPICGAAKIDCYTSAEDDLLTTQFMEGLNTEPGAESFENCNCLPACTSITYDAEVSQYPFDWKPVFNALGVSPDEWPGMQQISLSILFKENRFMASKRSELYGTTDFLANCGGLLGLFMGASFLSIVELVYYFSLRLCCNLRARMQRKNGVADSSVPEIVVVKPNDDDDKKE